jgi:hypothetical protein
VESVEGVADLSDASRAELSQWCDGEGRPTRADFVERHTKRRRAEQLAQGPPRTTLEADPPPEQELEEDLEDSMQTDQPDEQGLLGMSFWDDVSYDSVTRWIPTLGQVPKGAHHAVARLKGAIFKADQTAKHAGEAGRPSPSLTACSLLQPGKAAATTATRRL